MSDKARCSICGEPMPEGEEMFKFHGYSGDCPKPPLPKPKCEVLAEYFSFDDEDGSYWISVRVNREWVKPLGPFETAQGRQAALDDLLNMTRSLGAKDLPSRTQ